MKASLYLSIVIVGLLTLVGCFARGNPPHYASKDVAPKVAYLWDENSGYAQTVDLKSKTGSVSNQVSVGIDNGIIAVVNDRVITLNEFDVRFFSEIRRGVAPGIKLYQDVLNSMIERLLLIHEAKSQEVEVEELEIDEAFDLYVQQNGGQDEFKKMMHQNKQSVEAFKSQIEEDLIIKKLERQLYAGIWAIAPSDVKKEYAKRKEEFSNPDKRDISLILTFEESYKDPKKARSVIENAYKRLKKGESFEILAKAISEGPKAKEGGRLGFIERGELAAAIDNVAFGKDIKTGYLSNVLSLPGGYFIIKCHEVRAANQLSYEDVQGKLKGEIRRRKSMKRRNEILARLYSNAYIHRLSPTAYLAYRRKKG